MNAAAAVRIVASAVVLAAAAAGAVWLAESHLPPGPDLHRLDFKLRRSDRSELQVTPRDPLELPYPFADFDLAAELRLDPGTELDVVVRRVEPVLREHGQPPFHGRFAVLRISTAAAGPPLLGRDAALFGAATGGFDVPAAAPVPLELAGRGREIAVRLGGREVGRVPTADAHGALAFVVRGPGEAPRVVIDRLEIAARPRPRVLLPIGQAALLGAGLGLGFGWRRRWRGVPFVARLATAAAALLAGGLAGGAVVLAALAPETEPSFAGVLAASLSGAPVAVLLLTRPRPLLAVLFGGVVGLGQFELAVRLEAPRIAALDDLRLTAAFGAESGSAPFEALAGRVRAPSAVHVPDAAVESAMFLGGGPVFEGSARDMSQWTARLATSRLDRPLRPVVLPTVYGNLRQQLLLFETFYFLRYRPRLIVVGVPDWEPDIVDEPRVVAALDRAWEAGFEASARPAGPALWNLWQAARAGEVPVTALADARAAVERACDLAEVFDSAVVLVLAPGLPTPWRSQLGALVRERGGVVVDAPIGTDAEAAVDPLAEGMRRALRR